MDLENKLDMFRGLIFVKMCNLVQIQIKMLI